MHIYLFHLMVVQKYIAKIGIFFLKFLFYLQHFIDRRTHVSDKNTVYK